MVKRTITITTILLVLSIAVGLIIALNRASFAADDDIASGISGTCSWVIDKDGVLTISPTDGVSGVLEGSMAPWGTYGWNTNHRNDQVKKIVILEGVKAAPKSDYLFAEMRNCTEMDLARLNTDECTSMKHMFEYCKSITDINISSWNTSNVKDMSSMFLECKNLESINMSNCNTSNVNNIDYMFDNCSSLSMVSLSGFNNITKMKSAFSGCSSLTTIDVSNWNVSNVTNMSGLFYKSGITSIDLSSWEPRNVTTLDKMFYDCKDLTEVRFSDKWSNSNNLNSISHMFDGCKNLINVYLPKINTSNVTNMSYVFCGCSKLKNIDLSNWDTSSCSTMAYMFSWCSNLEEIDVSNFNTSSVTNMVQMFCSNTSLVNIDVTSFNTENVTSMSCMFSECRSLTTLNLIEFDTSNVTNMSSMFSGCQNLTTLNLENFDTNNVSEMQGMFNYCYNLQNINLGENFDFIDNVMVPNPPTDEYYTGYWIRENQEYGPYTAEELTDNYNGLTMSGAWVWQRKNYNVTYSYTGNIPDGASELPEKQTYKYEEEISLPENPSAPGYTFSGWQTDHITMPAEDIVISGYFIKDDVSKEYKIEYYFDGEKDDSLDETMNAEIDEEISIDPQKSLNFNNIHYSLVSENHKINVSENTENNIIRVYYETDVLDYNNEESNSGDGISDKYQVKIIYKVQNGTWNDGTSEDKKQIINLYDKDGNPAENGTGKITIPEVGSKPNEGYKEGSWNIKLPNAVTSEDNEKEFIYSYAKIGSISRIKGNLSNPKTDDIVQKYAIYGVLAILLMLVVKKTINKYSRKKRKIQF